MTKAFRNFGLLVALALFVYLVAKHMQNVVPSTGRYAPTIGGSYFGKSDSIPGNGVFQAEDIVAGNPNY